MACDEPTLFGEDVETVYVASSKEHAAVVTMCLTPRVISFDLSTEGCRKLARDLLAEAMKMDEDSELLDAWGIIDERLSDAKRL